MYNKFGRNNRVAAVKYGMLTLDKLYSLDEPTLIYNGLGDQVLVTVKKATDSLIKRLEFLDSRYLDLSSDTNLDLNIYTALMPSYEVLTLVSINPLQQLRDCFYFETTASFVVLNGIVCPVKNPRRD